MKPSQIQKRIPQTLTNSRDIIQTDREYARRSSRARSTRGQENEAWALYKKFHPGSSWGDLSGDRYILCPKPPYPAEKILDRRFKQTLKVTFRIITSLWVVFGLSTTEAEGGHIVISFLFFTFPFSFLTFWFSLRHLAFRLRIRFLFLLFSFCFCF